MDEDILELVWCPHLFPRPQKLSSSICAGFSAAFPHGKIVHIWVLSPISCGIFFCGLSSYGTTSFGITDKHFKITNDRLYVKKKNKERQQVEIVIARLVCGLGTAIVGK